MASDNLWYFQSFLLFQRVNNEYLLETTAICVLRARNLAFWIHETLIAVPSWGIVAFLIISYNYIMLLLQVRLYNRYDHVSKDSYLKLEYQKYNAKSTIIKHITLKLQLTATWTLNITFLLVYSVFRPFSFHLILPCALLIACMYESLVKSINALIPCGTLLNYYIDESLWSVRTEACSTQSSNIIFSRSWISCWSPLVIMLPKTFKIIYLSNCSTLRVPDEG